MGKKGGQGGGGGGYGSNKNSLNQPGLVLHARPGSLREQTGRRGAAAASAQTQNPSVLPSTLRAEHLLRLATWASANVPSLGALLGTRLGYLSEAAAAPIPESPHSICERCESIMQVGVNCSVRILKNKRKRKSRNADDVCNHVTYFCHYCKHGNSKPGTSKNHMKTKISQAAARSSLNELGLSKPVETIPNKKLLAPSKKSLLGSAGVLGRSNVTTSGPREPVEITLTKKPLDLVKNNQQECFAQAVSKTVEITLNDEVLDCAKKMLHEAVGVKVSNPVESTSNMEPLDLTEKIQLEVVGPQVLKPEESTSNMEPLDLTKTIEQEVVEPQVLKPEESTSNMEPLDLIKQIEQEVVEPQVLKPGESTSNMEPLDLVVMSQVESASQKAQDGPKSMGTSLDRKPLDLISRKKKKKKNQGPAENEGPSLVGMTPNKGLAVEVIDSAKCKKRKGWSTLKELASLPK